MASSSTQSQQQAPNGQSQQETPNNLDRREVVDTAKAAKIMKSRDGHRDSLSGAGAQYRQDGADDEKEAEESSVFAR